MTDLEMWSLVVGVLLPPLVAMVNQPGWSAAAKGVVAVLASVVAAAVTVWLRGDLSGGTWLHSMLVVAVAAIASYQAWWKPTGIAPAIERATSRQ